MRLPASRGPVSEMLTGALRSAPGPLPAVPASTWTGLRRPVAGLGGVPVPDGARGSGGGPDVVGTDPIHDEDLQLTLFICYGLHYQGWDGVADGWEWEPSLLALRAAAERRFHDGLRALVGPVPLVDPARVPAELVALVAADDGPPLAATLQRRADLERFREFVIHRSIYHLREADPHTWAIPRLAGQAKAALVEIQYDEYGGGRLERMHSELFRVTMRWFGLETGYGHYVDAVPAVTLATNNLLSFFGLHRRWRGALLGQLAAFEMTSSLPNRRYGDGLRRLGGTPEATRFYDEHVEADAVHEQIAVTDMCGPFALAEPAHAGDVLFGAACGLALDRCLATHLLASWYERGGSSLRDPVPGFLVPVGQLVA